MTKRSARPRRRNGRYEDTAEIIPLPKLKHHAERIAAADPAAQPTQADYLDALRTSPQVIVLGPAGTGKTWIAATYAADLYRARQIARIILTRPNVPCGRSLGFFPGSLDDKFAPWAAPVIEAIEERIGAAAFDIALKNGAIELAPFEVMRGRSWKQRLRAARRGAERDAGADEDVPHPHRRGLPVVVNGDVSQSDIERDVGPARGARSGRAIPACRCR